MEALFFLGAIFSTILIWASFEDYKAKKRIEAEMAAERKRSPVNCGICKKPNKKPGEGTCEKFKETGPSKIKICADCNRKYFLCYKCEKPIERSSRSVFVTRDRANMGHINGLYCKSCFEGRVRFFADTRDAALMYHGNYCDICKSSRNLHVHHKTYVRERREHLNDLVVLCKSCHYLQHSQVHTGPRGGKYVYKKGKKKYVTDKDIAYQPAQGDKARFRRSN